MPTELSIEESADEAAQIRSKEQATADALSAQLATTISTNITTTSITIDQQSYTERHSTEIINDEMTSSTTSSNDGASANGFHGSSSSLNGFGKRSSITTPDPIAYVTKARVTRPTPPAPSYNPLQFVAIKPCNLYQTAQEQLKKADEVKKLKEVKKEDPEEWQNNLDSWKSSRRKRVEHIIDRVVEAKKLELEEHDRLRRKSKTFSEMIEDRAERAGSRTLTKLVSLAVYNEEEANDLSDLGIGTSSTSGKSSLSEDYDNNSVMSDNANESTEKCSNGGDKLTSASNGAQQMQLQEQQQQILSTNREYVSSPGYDTSSSTAPASSPEPCEYTYEGAIQDYKQRVSRAVSAGGLTSSTTNGTANKATHNSKDSTPERSLPAPAWPRRGSKIEDRVAGFGLASTTTTNADSHADSQPKVDLPKIDISKRKEIFESQRNSLASSEAPTSNGHVHGNSNAAPVPRVTLRKGFVVESNGSSSSATPPAKVEVRRMSGDITSIRDRLQSLEQQRNSANGAKVIDVPVPPLKQRLSSLQNAVTKDEIRKPPVMLVDERQLEIMKNEDEVAKQRQLKAAFEQQQHQPQQPQIEKPKPKLPEVCEVIVEAVSPTNDLPDEQEQQLNAAIAALALQQQQLEAAANVVNQIEAEFAELADLNPAPLASNKPTVAPAAKPASSAEQPVHDDMEFSVSSTNVSSSSKSTPTPTPTCGNGNENMIVVGSRSAPAQHSPGDSTVLGSSLVRKPSIQPVHARNLLKMFKETFEDEPVKDDVIGHKPAKSVSIENCESVTDPVAAVGTKKPNAMPSLIPTIAAMSPVIGKPPMSPKAARYSNSKLPLLRSPLCSPTPSRKHDDNNQFSINGRVEIFNSKNVDKSTALLATKKTTSTSTTTTHLPQLAVNKRDEIGLPSASATAAAVTALRTVNEPQIDAEASTMPRAAPPTPPPRPSSAQSAATTRSPTPTELVVCASPVTQLNPEELPKPNTVRALSSCFSKEQAAPPMPPPKPPKVRSRIPTPSPPPSPALGGRRSNDVVDHAMAKANVDPLAPNDGLRLLSLPVPATRAKVPELKICTPNESTLFKLAGSAPPSPISPLEPRCTKLDVRNAAGGEDFVPSTSFQIVTEAQINHADGVQEPAVQAVRPSTLDAQQSDAANAALCASLLDSLAPPQPPEVEELACTKVDVRDLPPAKPLPATPCLNVSLEEVQRCDNSTATPNQTQTSKRISTPATTPIMAARAAHSKALAETCEKIIAEERLASSQMRNSLPSSPRATPLFGRKSKIPKPVPCCISASDSVGQADYVLAAGVPSIVEPPTTPTHKANKPKTPTTPPSSAAASPKASPKPKKTKNIFDFLRRNFGHGDDSDKSADKKAPAPAPAPSPTKERIVSIDNSKFYVSSDAEDEATEATPTTPPPLPKSPIPVNIEITKTIVTDEFADSDNNSSITFSQEINEMLDAELNKLNNRQS